MGALIERVRRDPQGALAWVIATGFGTGLSPVAPGTVGSLAAAALYYFSPLDAELVTKLPSGHSVPAPAILIIAASYFVGVCATEKLASPEDPDPGRVVWDEFVGMWVTCLFLPKDVAWLAVAFVAFRLLDVIKPFPIRRLERFPGGWGIMADDLLAGVYGAVLCNGFVWALAYYSSKA